MQKYLSLRQASQDGNAPELQKRLLICFRTMSRLFGDPTKAEEGFRILNQLKDANIWKILTSLLDPNTSFQQAYTFRDELLKILGEKHPLYDFLDTLSMKCSYLLFNKEYVKEILLEVRAQKSAGNSKLVLSCLNLLVILASFSPLFLSGVEEDLVNLLKEDNEIIKEGIVHVLARAGGTIREQLAKTSSSVELLLETLCLEGSRKQAKYSVQALAAITKDDGLKSLSVLYKRLVDILEKRTHLPAVLQSLGCIAQTAMSVFETREAEVVEFIMNRILKSSDVAEDNTKTWDEPSELCLLKIYGIKALVKSYLPVRDAHLRLGIENLIGIIKNTLSFGEVSEDIKSSNVDKAHLGLASAKAILRLSKCWDHKIPIDVFHLILRISQDTYPQVRKLFLNKVHQYIKERLLDAKYASAFLFNLSEFQEQDKHNLIEIVQMCQQVKTRQLSMQRDVNSSMPYPEYILAYLVHALAHHSCPDVDKCKEVQAFESIYRQLYVFLSVVLHGYEDGQLGVSAKGKEVAFTIMSILQTIKCSEDIVDGTKSKNVHAICDLGLSITKRLVRNEADVTGLTSVPLPPAMYKPLEKNDSNESETSAEASWLGGDAAMAHFESIKFENKEINHQDNAEDENAQENIDGDEADLPLGKMMKRLKSKRMKKKKVGNNHTLVSERNNTENDIDILDMVREINIDNIERVTDMEFSKLVKDDTPHDSGEEIVPVSQKRKRVKTSDPVSNSIKKHKISPYDEDITKHSFSKNSTKGARKVSRSNLKAGKVRSLSSDEMDVELNNTHSGAKPSKEKYKVKLTESDTPVSPKIKGLSLRRKKKGNVHNSNDIEHTVGESFNHDQEKSPMLVEAVKKNSFSNLKSSTGSTKKRKRRSIAGLAKCSSEKALVDNAELVGCRVKVWWPMDMQFYEGVVQSYDPQKKKHVILYEDGDVEVLKLEKEKWEVVGDDLKPQKRLKLEQVSPSKGSSPTQKNRKRASGVSRQNKSPNKKFRRKTTPKKMEHGQNDQSESNIAANSSDNDNKGTPDTLSAHSPVADSEAEHDSDGSEGKAASPTQEAEKVEDDSADPKVSDEERSYKEELSESSDKGEAQVSDDEPLSTWKVRAAKGT